MSILRLTCVQRYVTIKALLRMAPPLQVRKHDLGIPVFFAPIGRISRLRLYLFIFRAAVQDEARV
jgi:hypothetical protein